MSTGESGDEGTDPKNKLYNRKSRAKGKALKELAKLHKRYKGQALVEFWMAQCESSELGFQDARRLLREVFFEHESSAVQGMVGASLAERGRRALEAELVQWASLPDRLRPRFSPLRSWTSTSHPREPKSS